MSGTLLRPSPMAAMREQASAFTQLRTLAEPLGLRVVADSEGFPVIPGRYGQIEWVGGPHLAVYSDHPRLFPKLLAVAGVQRHQTGDQEMRALFEPEALASVAKVIHAHRKPGVRSDAARLVGARTAFKATSERSERDQGTEAGQHIPLAIERR